jgi:hypothetical protein
MASSGMLRRVALVRTDGSEERIASIIRATSIGELGTTLAVSSNPEDGILHSETCSLLPYSLTGVERSTYIARVFVDERV